MKNLLKKEMKFASILSYIFIAFSIMTLIPNYPILISSFFVCFGIFHTFQSCREANDTLYSAMLPVKKSDVVKAKFLFTILIQSMSFVLMFIFVVIRTFLLNNFSPYNANSLMNANLVFLGFVLLIFTCFNILFLGNFYKTAYKIGIPFLTFGITTLFVIVIGEALHFMPGLNILNANFHFSHIIIFVVCIALYFVGTCLSLKKSQRLFNKIDL